MSNIPDFDQDVDGMPDWYEVQYGGDATSMLATDDDDNDGVSNYDEWVADTIPTDSNSFLRVSSYTNTAEVAFDCSTNRKYQIQFRLDLTDTNEAWQAEPGYESWITPTSSTAVEPVSTTTSNRFYRIDVKVR